MALLLPSLAEWEGSHYSGWSLKRMSSTKGRRIKRTSLVWLIEGHVCGQGFLLPAVTENLWEVLDVPWFHLCWLCFSSLQRPSESQCILQTLVYTLTTIIRHLFSFPTLNILYIFFFRVSTKPINAEKIPCNIFRKEICCNAYLFIFLILISTSICMLLCMASFLKTHW